MTATSPKNSILAIAAAMALAPTAALVFLTPGASAQARQPAFSVEVEIVDQETGVTESVETIRERIEIAAAKACAAIATRSPLVPREQADCVNATIVDALQKLDDQNTLTLADAQ